MLKILFLFFSVSLMAQNTSDYYLKIYANSYRQVNSFFNEDYSLVDQENNYIFNTFSFDFLYRLSKNWQIRTVVPLVSAHLKKENRSEFTDLWTELDYILNPYPNKLYFGIAYKFPLDYKNKQSIWLSNRAHEIRFLFLIKEKFSKDMDFEVDLKYDHSITKSERINKNGYQIPYYISLSYYKDEMTVLPVLSGAFKSYQYISFSNEIEQIGDKYNEFSMELGLTIKYKLQAELEFELSYLRTVFGFQAPVANHYGLGISFGVRD